MTPKEYLRQAYRLDQRIRIDTEEIKQLREMACGVSAICYDRERVQSSVPSDAPFVRALERLEEMEQKTSRELSLLSDLKKQISEVIRAVPDTDERLILHYRYVDNMTWERIGEELHADRTTVYRWHGNALQHVVLPEHPIIV
ncbi:MAG: DUF1492 domain-containing protein [Anaerovoracaceae bacterium]|jgi:DNA-directed RNA polymerase specialized sigma subunit